MNAIQQLDMIKKTDALLVQMENELEKSGFMDRDTFSYFIQGNKYTYYIDRVSKNRHKFAISKGLYGFSPTKQYRDLISMQTVFDAIRDIENGVISFRL